MIDLDQVRAALAAATPGPWRQGDLDYRGYVETVNPDGPTLFRAGVNNPNLEADAALVAATPTWLAELCDEVERLRRRVAGDEFVAEDGPLTCGCADGSHPNHPNYLAGAAERDGRTCKLGWST